MTSSFILVSLQLPSRTRPERRLLSTARIIAISAASSGSTIAIDSGVNWHVSESFEDLCRMLGPVEWLDRLDADHAHLAQGQP